MLDGIFHGDKARSAGSEGKRCTFGVLFPEGFIEEPSLSETEVLLEAEKGAAVDIVIRFLHACRLQMNGADGVPAGSLDVDGMPYVSRDEAVLRETTLHNLPLRALERAPCVESFLFSGERVTESLRSKSGETVGAETRSCEAIKCALAAHAESLREGLYRLRVSLRNTTPLQTACFPGAAARCALHSAHIVLLARDAKFISLLHPPGELAATAAACKQRGLWPVLSGSPGARDVVLASPIILRDHPLSGTSNRDRSPPDLSGPAFFLSLGDVTSPENGDEA